MNKNKPFSLQDKVSRKTFLRYLVVALASFAAASPLMYFFQDKSDKTQGRYGSMPYGGTFK